MNTTTNYLSALPRRGLLRLAFLGLALFLVAGLLAPWIDGSRFSGAIQSSLENMLGRRVQFEKVHFTLFSGPGFSLENVLISEDSRYGLEPFAFVPTLQVRVRPDKLLLGRIQLSSLRLIEPSLNLVKRSDETWNVVELVRRLGAPRRSPLNLFPVLEVQGGRIDFKFGINKTTLYVLDADLSVYPEHSGKLSLQFSGSPARTDRAGNGFGHVRGRVTCNLNRSAGADDQLRADLNLDPSNLSELTTLLQGHDVGVHGTVSTHLIAEGPLQRLRLRGSMQFEDVHRWDLLPSSGEDWNFRYGGVADLDSHRLTLETLPPRGSSRESSPVALTLRLDNFLTRPDWSLAAQLRGVPLVNLLPLGRRMGVNLPSRLTLTGTVDGAITVTNAAGISGSGVIRDMSATLPDTPPLNAAVVNVSVQQDRVHFEPATLATAGGSLQVGGDLFMVTPQAAATIAAQNFPIGELKNNLKAWFGVPAPLDLVREGTLSGQLLYARTEDAEANWTGRFQFAGATLNVPGIAAPLRESEGRVTLNGAELEVSRFSALAGKSAIRGNYRYNPAARHPEHLHLELSAVELGELQQLLAPTLEAQGWLARLRVARRSIPAWLADRNMDGDILVNQFSVDDIRVGSLSSRFTWRGTTLQFPSVSLKLLQGTLHGEGTIGLASYAPRYDFTARVDGFPWHGGTLHAEGAFHTNGAGADLARHLRATGNFSGDDLMLAPDSAFSKVTGAFAFSFADGWPNLQFSNLQAEDGENSWTGTGSSQADGKVVLDLEHAGQQKRIISSLLPESNTAASLANGSEAPVTAASSRSRLH